MTSQLRRTIVKRSSLNNKANNSSKPADKIAYNIDKFSR